MRNEINQRVLHGIEVFRRNRNSFIRTEEGKSPSRRQPEICGSFRLRKREEDWEVFLCIQNSGRMPAGREMSTTEKTGHAIPLAVCFLYCKLWKENAESEKTGGRNETEEIISFELGICL